MSLSLASVDSVRSFFARGFQVTFARRLSHCFYQLCKVGRSEYFLSKAHLSTPVFLSHDQRSILGHFLERLL